jgi:hypothetical protein
MGQCQDSYGSLLVPIILDKLPTDIRKNLPRENERSYWQLNIYVRPSMEAHHPTAIFYTEAKTKFPTKFNTHAANSQSKPNVK